MKISLNIATKTNYFRSRYINSTNSLIRFNITKIIHLYFNRKLVLMLSILEKGKNAQTIFSSAKNWVTKRYIIAQRGIISFINNSFHQLRSHKKCFRWLIIVEPTKEIESKIAKRCSFWFWLHSYVMSKYILPTLYAYTNIIRKTLININLLSGVRVPSSWIFNWLKPS